MIPGDASTDYIFCIMIWSVLMEIWLVGSNLGVSQRRLSLRQWKHGQPYGLNHVQKSMSKEDYFGAVFLLLYGQFAP